ncbi:hypothetical protein GLAREA_05383 [Glarea lozoyensis ATCC 20868]|uniref:Transglycosylase SLT domain-containing protein n=1 Tax=Glarea lozoyensis (strain ATCC 20868 / MF5171) TaxID=1116229 RepID=S3DE62_GLAL2|nr:uncharacterized protein GLAREA_05383 [Glarea lozoyensis ATCC 20868]EPE36045.1 hypothetical protein GLAREA_05383 [Glarea lozoyensis ATCC 20868]
MAYFSAVLLLLSLVSQSWALPVSQTGTQDMNITYTDGDYHWTEITASTTTPVALPEITTPVTTSESTQQTASSTSGGPSSTTTVVNTPQSTGEVPVTSVPYTKFSGDGSEAAGWPSIAEWVSFDQMWANNKPILEVSCAAQGVENNSEEEIAQMKAAILEQAAATKVDPRFILATIMSESTGCVRVITTRSPGDLIINPGLMQDHQGTGSCEGIPAPCPEAQIKQMIMDGTAGTEAILRGGDGLQQTLQKAAAFGKDAQAVYVAARIYNSGSYVSGALEDNAATACYSSDIANYLLGFAAALSPCKLGIV